MLLRRRATLRYPTWVYRAQARAAAARPPLTPAPGGLLGAASISAPGPVFDNLRQSLRDFLRHPGNPEERQARLAQMKQTLVQARVGLAEMREGLAEAHARLAAEQRELETVRRRKQLAAGIGDAETVAIAERYERLHAERAAIAQRKIQVQEEEVALGEREIAEMTAELRGAIAGVGQPAGVEPPPEMPDLNGEALREELEGMGRARARAARDADAAARLEALKRRMGK